MTGRVDVTPLRHARWHDPPFLGIAALAAEQHNVVTRAQMRGTGYKQSAIDRVRATGVLRTVERGTYLHGSDDPSWRQKVAATVARGGDDMFATAQPALVMHGVLDHTDEVVVVVPYGKRLRLQNATVIRTRRPLTRTRVLDGVPVVSVERALLDAAALLDATALECAVEAALLRSKTTETRLWITLVEQGGRGVRGSNALRRVLVNRPHGRPARSVLEVLAGRMLRTANLGGFVRNYTTAVHDVRYELDFAFVTQRVVLEVDGKAFHTTASQVGRDRKRQAALEAAGWRFLRVSWFDVVCAPERVVADLAALLAA